MKSLLRHAELRHARFVEVDAEAGGVGNGEEAVHGARILPGNLLAQRGFHFRDELHDDGVGNGVEEVERSYHVDVSGEAVVRYH